MSGLKPEPRLTCREAGNPRSRKEAKFRVCMECFQLLRGANARVGLCLSLTSEPYSLNARNRQHILVLRRHT
jgi:hypothetical protein